MSAAKKRKRWEETYMEKALEAVQKNLTSVTTAVNKFNVPHKTLDDRVKGRGDAWEEVGSWDNSYPC